MNPPPAIRTLISEPEIQARIQAMAKEIAQKLPPDMLIVALLRGSFMFAADLIRALHTAGCRPQIDFLTLGSYGEAMKSSGQVTLQRGTTDEIIDRDVLILDDILESGRTLAFAHDLLKRLGARSLSVAVLLEKPGTRAAKIDADFVGFHIPDQFVVGYGLDYANYYRELPYIGVIER